MTDASLLDDRLRAFVERARSATLATIAPDGRPRLVPICFVLAPSGEAGPDRLYSPLDEKPKTIADPLDLARVRDLGADARATLLVDRWSEDWDTLGWVRLEVRGALLEPRASDRAVRAEHETAVAGLRARYPQYAAHRLAGRPILRFTIERVVDWGDLGG